MIAMAGIGALIGVCIIAVLSRLVPLTPSPLVRLGQFDAYQNDIAQARIPDGGPGGSVSWPVRLGRLLSEQLHRQGIAYTSLRQDLALTGRSFEATLAGKSIAFTVGFLLALLSAVLLQRGVGLGLPTGSPAALALAVGGVFFFLPDLDARTEARARRRDFRRALSAYLDLVALEMAGAAAPAEALPRAARVGTGWPLALLRDTLFRATAVGRSQWEALSDLGARIGVPELRDLGALVSLVDQDGAQVRDTLAARAATMRARELADAEATAGEHDESMRMAQLLIAFGFIIFVGYPALAAVASL